MARRKDLGISITISRERETNDRNQVIEGNRTINSGRTFDAAESSADQRDKNHDSNTL